MRQIKTLSIILLMAIFVSACSAAPATPPITSEDVQTTAIAAAFTVIAQTQAAIPTNTPIPPTETPTQTPLPTDTPTLLPTLDMTLTSTAAPQSGGGDP